MTARTFAPLTAETLSVGDALDAHSFLHGQAYHAWESVLVHGNNVGTGGDDSTALADAISAAEARGGVPVVLPGQSTPYRVDTPVPLAEGVPIVATRGMLGSTVIRGATIQASGDHAIFDATAIPTGRPIEMLHLSLSGPNANLTPPRQGTGIVFSDAAEVNGVLRLDDVQFLGLKWGISTARALICSRFDRCTWQRCDIGVRSTYTGADNNINRFDSCHFNPGNENGIVFASAATGRTWAFRDCWFEHINDAALDLQGIQNVRLDDCWFEDVSRDGTATWIKAGSGFSVLGGTWVRTAGDAATMLQVAGSSKRVLLDGLSVVGTTPTIDLNSAADVRVFNCDFPSAGVLTNDTGVITEHGNTNYAKSTDPIFLNPGDFELMDGTPARTTVGAAQRITWDFDATAQEIIGTSIRAPKHWTNMMISLLWSVGAGSGNVFWDVLIGGVANGGSLSGADGIDVSGIIAAPSANVLKTSVLSSSVAIPAGDALFVRVLRVAGSGSDTHTADAKFLGLLLEKA